MPLRVDLASANEWDALRYRRLDAWLPHGLAAGTTVADLAPLVTLCQARADGSCTPVDVQLEAVSKGRMRLHVPALVPGGRWQLQVEASDAVRDGFGLPLLGSQTSFRTAAIDDAFTGPNLASGARVGVFESGSAIALPWVSRGKAADVRSAAYWRLDLSTETAVLQALRLLSYYSELSSIDSVLGRPTGSVAHAVGGNATAAVLQHLELQGGVDGSSATAAYMVHTCCIRVTYPTSRAVSASVQLIMASPLAASVVMAGDKAFVWITRTADAAPVAGASVVLFSPEYSTRTHAARGRCTTDADGACSVAVSNADGRYGSLSLYAKSVDGALLLLPDVSYVSALYRPQYVTSVVLDRKVVRPGDTLHVSGYIAQRSGADLALPSAAAEATLEVAPGWGNSTSAAAAASGVKSTSDGKSGGGRTEEGFAGGADASFAVSSIARVAPDVSIGGSTASSPPVVLTTVINADYGTFSLAIPVPATAKLGSYQLNLRLPGE